MMETNGDPHLGQRGWMGLWLWAVRPDNLKMFD